VIKECPWKMLRFEQNLTHVTFILDVARLKVPNVALNIDFVN
jgi:hypothetical protein